MFEATETMTVPLMSREFETDAAELLIEVRYWTDDGIELQAEPISYRRTGDERDNKITNNCPLSEFVSWIVRSEIDDAALRIIQANNPAFESMGYGEPAMSRDEFQRMVL